MGRTAWLQGRTTHVLTTQPPFAIGIAGTIAYMTVLQHWVAHPMADAEKYLSAEADDHFHDECGVFGIFGRQDAAAIVTLGLHALQHRGQEAAGIVSYDGSAVPRRAPCRPDRRHLHQAGGDRPAAGQPRHRPHPLRDHRRRGPAQRAAAFSPNCPTAASPSPTTATSPMP